MTCLFLFPGLFYYQVNREDLIKQVKYNCNVSDAKFWGFYSICGLLMRMRELYLSEHALEPWDTIENEAISSWIHERESLWKNLEEEELRSLIIDGISYDPFDSEGLNTALERSGLVYGGGYGTFRKPTFFIADFDSDKELYDYHVSFAGRELCRDLAAYPAMLQGRCITIRADILRSILWDKFQVVKSRQLGGLTEEMFLLFGIKKTDTVSEDFLKGVDAMAHIGSDLFVLHETGEAFEDDFSEEWLEILHASRGNKYVELYLRGIKDLLADTSDMGPLKAIISGKNRTLLIVYMVFLDGVRKEIFSEIGSAFQQFVESERWAPIENARLAGYRKARELREKVFQLWREHREMADIESVLREHIKKTSPA
jgi:hypothetical protein